MNHEMNLFQSIVLKSNPATANLNHHLVLNYLEGLVEQSEDFELVTSVNTFGLCLRYTAAWDQADTSVIDLLNEHILHTVVIDKQPWLSRKLIKGRPVINVSFGAQQIELTDMLYLLDYIRELGFRFYGELSQKRSMVQYA